MVLCLNHFTVRLNPRYTWGRKLRLDRFQISCFWGSSAMPWDGLNLLEWHPAVGWTGLRGRVGPPVRPIMGDGYWWVGMRPTTFSTSTSNWLVCLTGLLYICK